MGVPTYLVLSRHHVYYLRWPLPKALREPGKALDIKVSLHTRCRREALNLSRVLAYLAETLTSRAVASGMRYDEIRAVIKRHFETLLEQRKDEINVRGRLGPDDRSVLEGSLSVARMPISEQLYPGYADDREGAVGRFQRLYGLSLEPGSREHRWLTEELQRGHRDYLAAVLRFDQSLESYDFNSEAALRPSEVVGENGAEPVTPLAAMVQCYLDEGIRGERWAPKTLGDKREQFALLGEIIGSDTDVRVINAAVARQVKEVVLKYPKNRNKNVRTRGLSLVDALTVDGVPTISIKTVNTYLTAYGTLFSWAKQNGYVTDNHFAGMSVRRGKNQVRGGRDPFSPEQCRLMLDELLANRRGLIRKPYQKWGPLIGLYTGARLGEIAQLRLADVREQDGIRCFDFNDDDGKRLKTHGSKRLVPVHAKLVEFGLLEHIDAMRKKKVEKLFPEFAYCPKNGWGRNLGQWFNNRFLDQLGMKRQELVFHSLRHTVVTRLSQSGVPEPIVKAIVGHAQEGVTQQHYMREGYKLEQLAQALDTLPY